MVDVDFSLDALELAIMAGADLMLAVGSFSNAARHIQEIQMRKKQKAREYLEAHCHLFPSTAHHVGEIFRAGVIPPSLMFRLQTDRSDYRIRGIRV